MGNGHHPFVAIRRRSPAYNLAVRDFLTGARDLFHRTWALVDWLSYDPGRPVSERVLYAAVVVVLTAAVVALFVVALIVGA